MPLQSSRPDDDGVGRPTSQALSEALDGRSQDVRCRLLVADDHAVVRHALVSAIANSMKFVEPVAEASTAQETLSKTQGVRPDVVVLDLRLPDESGLATCRRLTSQLSYEPRVIILTMARAAETARNAIRAGASGFVCKVSEPQVLERAIHEGTREKPFLDPNVAGLAQARPLLASREIDVVSLVAAGLTNTEIAGELYLSVHSVKTLLQRAGRKLGARNRAECVANAVASGLIEARITDKRG